MSDRNPAEQRVDDLNERLVGLKRAMLEARDTYIESLDDDEQDLAFDRDDDDDDANVERFEKELQAADEFRVEVEDGEPENIESGTAKLDTVLTLIADDLNDWQASLKKRGIEPDEE